MSISLNNSLIKSALDFKERKNMKQSPFVNGINCTECGSPEFYVIHDGSCPVLVISCKKCGKTREFLLESMEE
jgi:predicted nucleic-acid-binding Zn-ribbon protein